MRTKNFRIVNKGGVGKNKIKIAVWSRDTNKRKYFTMTRKLYSEIKAMVRNNYFKNCDELINYIISQKFDLDIKPIEKLELNLNEEKAKVKTILTSYENLINEGVKCAAHIGNPVLGICKITFENINAALDIKNKTVINVVLSGWTWSDDGSVHISNAYYIPKKGGTLCLVVNFIPTIYSKPEQILEIIKRINPFLMFLCI